MDPCRHFKGQKKSFLEEAGGLVILNQAEGWPAVGYSCGIRIRSVINSAQSVRITVAWDEHDVMSRERGSWVNREVETGTTKRGASGASG